MKPKLLLRISALLMMLHTIGHTMGALTWKKAPNAQVGNVINSMLSVHFSFMGRQASMGLFFEGYGISMIFVLLLVTALLWILSSNRQYPFIVVLSMFLLTLGIVEYVYFFPLASVLTLMAGLCAGLTAIPKLRNAV